MRALLSLALFSGAACAQDDRPQMIWEGEVDGVVVLRVHGNRVDVDEEQGMPVQRQRPRFSERLPERRQSVRMDVVEGRGRASIVEQPRPENNYTLSVRIEDRQGGSSFYSLAFFWSSGGGFLRDRDPDPPAPPRVDRENSVWWTGRVDGEAIVSCHDRVCDVDTPRGAPVERDRYRFSRPLPDRDVTVSLEETHGRGDIRLVEQPRERNGHTARVAIRDHQGGSADYSFMLVWTPPARSDRGFEFSRRGMVWSGRVDGRVRVIVEGNSARIETISGAPVSRERASFERDLPRRDNSNATVRKLHGRGRVEIVAYPSRRNNYQLVFEIEDNSGGADNYEIEVGW